MPRLKVGIIGAGMAFERLHYPAYQRLGNQYQIAAVCDADLARAKTWAERLRLGQEQAYADFPTMLARVDLDVVDIMVPIPLNYQVTAEVARLLAGQPKGIISEKPLAPTLSQAQAARDLPRKYGLPIMIAENYRYSEEVNLIRDLVGAGRIGEVYYFRARYPKVHKRAEGHPGG